jgi:hypothetical protein
MERRIAMFPAGFDKEGQMFSNTRFGDFPQKLPTKQWTNKDELFAGWMLLSYKKKVQASSTLDTMFANKTTDENPRSYWVAKQNKKGESLTIDLESEQNVNAVQINYVDYKNNVFDSDSSVYTQFKIWTSTDQKNWKLAYDLSKETKKDRACAYVEFDQTTKARYVKYEHIYTKGPNLAISDFRVFGKGQDNAPQTPKNLTAIRDKDQRNVIIKWDKSTNVVGYNILWGIKKDKLYQTYQVWGDSPNQQEIRALNTGVGYFFAIEAFNENGVSLLSDVIEIK